MFQLYFLFRGDNRGTKSSSIWKPGYRPPLLSYVSAFSMKNGPNISVLLPNCLPPGNYVCYRAKTTNIG